MTRVLVVVLFILSGLIALIVPSFTAPDYTDNYGPISIAYSTQAVLLCLAITAIVVLLLAQSHPYSQFLIRLFLAALLVRMIVATAIFVFNGQAFFGGDAFTYDFFGFLQVQGWAGDQYSQLQAYSYVSKAGTGWGMIYFVAAVYELTGRNMFATQLINAALGAATAPLIFLSASTVFENSRVARLAACGVGFMPSLVLWSAQGLKDGPIMFCLALAMLATLKLRDHFNIRYLVALVGALLCILAFRFYVFYMMVVAIGGTLIISVRVQTVESLTRQFILFVLLGVTITFFGAIMGARADFETYGSLEQVQVSRADSSTSARSGFAKEVNVSTTGGALSAIPRGLAYLLFAPFPWEIGSLRQAITVPEMLIWWASFPMLVLGIWFSIKYRFRQVLPILAFTIMLTLAYSVFQGNIGNAYRQRAQLLIFYFMFAAVGYVLLLERKPERSDLHTSAPANRVQVGQTYRGGYVTPRKPQVGSAVRH